MSFAVKQDLVGLEQTGLKVRANSTNNTNTVLEIPSSNGSIIGDEITGHISAPTCEYAITSSNTLSGLKLGYCYNDNFALAGIKVSTSAGGEPTVEANAVQIEDDAT